MDEQEILSRLKAHVARHQSFSPDEQRPSQPRSDVSSIEVSNLSRLSAEVWTAREAVGQLNPRNSGPLNRLAQAFKKVLQRSLSWYTRSLQAFHYHVARTLEEQGTAINSVERSLRQLQDEILKLQNEIPAIEQSHQRSKDEFLQESLRTTELAIQEQLAPYVELFRGLSPVVDIGCGRGEFLALLKDHGIAAYGVDSDHAACEVARRKLLTIVDGDLFEHLRQLPERSLGGVFSARVIEYLPVHLQMGLISLCSRKIKPGGLVVIETTNSESTPGYGRTSYLDPTHLRTVSPALLKTALESNGFRDVRIGVLAAVEGCLAPTTQSSGLFNRPRQGGQLLPGASNSLADSQAYAAVGWRI